MHKEGDKHTEETKAKISESLLNNLNAEKWTEDKVTSVLLEMIEWMKTPQSIEVYTILQTRPTKAKGAKVFDEDLEDSSQALMNFQSTKTIEKRPHLKKEALLEFDIYNSKWFGQMAEKFKENITVSFLLETIDTLCEVNTYNSAVSGVCDAGMAKINLSTHYGWADKKETKQENIGDTIKVVFQSTKMKPITSESDFIDD